MKYYNDNTMIFLNGNFVKASEARASLYLQGLHYGSAVFEGIRAYGTSDGARIFKAREHFERLHFSAEKMNVKLCYSVEEMEQLSYQLLQLNNLSDAYIRPLVFPGENMSLTETDETNVFIAAWEWGKYLGDKMLKVCLSSFQRPNPQACFVEAKVAGHYINSILATNEARKKGFDEALLTDLNGYVAEGPGANFFYEKNGKLFTSPKGNILPGITRQTVFEIANELGFQAEEKFFTPEDLYDADAAFFCGTASEIIGIAQFNNYSFPLPWENSVSAVVQKKYKRRVAFNEYHHLYI